jgi:hypothetical protein
MNAEREMTPEERAHVSLRCRFGLHQWSVWLPIALSRPPMKKRLCFGCPKIQWEERT